jgi:hypothetical protein
MAKTGIRIISAREANQRQKAVLARIAERQVMGDDSGIDYSDIPALTDEQLARSTTYSAR